MPHGSLPKTGSLMGVFPGSHIVNIWPSNSARISRPQWFFQMERIAMMKACTDEIENICFFCMTNVMLPFRLYVLINFNERILVVLSLWMQINTNEFILRIIKDDKNGKAGTKAGYKKLWRAHTPRQDQFKPKGIHSLLFSKKVSHAGLSKGFCNFVS